MPPPEKPPKPRPKLQKRPAAEVKPMPTTSSSPPELERRDGTPGVAILQHPFSCETYRLCPPPPAPPATVHLRSGRLPTPLIALSASLLAVSAVLLLALLVRYLVRRRRRAPQDGDEESVVLGVEPPQAAWQQPGAGEEEADDGDVHHVWFIRTKGLEERAIAAIAAVVYDAKKKRGAGAGDGCAVCLAEFEHGETLRLLPLCGHAFHRGCIDPWLRAHVNCPLCRAPVQAPAGAKRPAAATEEAERRVAPERAVRRAASMVTVPRRAWPDIAVPAPASSSGREEDMTGLAKIRRLLKLSDALDMAGVRSASFSAGTCHRAPTTGPSRRGERVEDGGPTIVER